jgi:hypothetical protein
MIDLDGALDADGQRLPDAWISGAPRRLTSCRASFPDGGVVGDDSHSSKT